MPLKINLLYIITYGAWIKFKSKSKALIVLDIFWFNGLFCEIGFRQNHKKFIKFESHFVDIDCNLEFCGAYS